MEINKIDYNEKIKKIKKKIKQKNNIELLEKNNVEYKVTAYNIDSRFRNKDPKNILDSKIFYLNDNNFEFTKNSNILKINFNFEENYFDINDRIIIENFTNKSLVFKDNIYFLKNFSYGIIFIENHNLLSSLEDQYINIIPLNEINDFYGNIPSNVFRENKKIIFYENLIDKINKTNLMNHFNEISSNLIFFELPYSFSSENNNDLVQVINIFKFDIDSVAGIPSNYINANYPITFKNNKGYHKIVDVDDENIYIDLNIEANNNIIFGNKNIKLCKIKKTIEGYVDNNYYIVNLKKSFVNVVRIELVSSEFYFIDLLIKANGENKNNSLYWQNIEDGDYVYKVELDEGNYSPSHLLEEILNKTNNLKRKNHTDENPSFNYFEIDLDSDKNLVEFKSFKFDILPESLTIDIVKIDDEFYYQMSILHPNNFVEMGDNIEISNSNDVGIVPNTTINTTHTVYKINKNLSTYSVILPPFQKKSTSSEGNGGESVTIKSRSLVRLLFDRNDTIGKVLGFKNVGNENSITSFKHTISNKDDYNLPNNFNSVGEENINNNFLNFTGNNLYLLMYLNDFQSIRTNSDAEDAFAKILLPGSLGDAVFNSFVNFPIEFDIPINTIDQFVVKFLYPNNTSPQFNNIEHSFTLLITEKKDTNDEIGTESKKSSFNRKIYEIKSTKF